LIFEEGGGRARVHPIASQHTHTLPGTTKIYGWYMNARIVGGIIVDDQKHIYSRSQGFKRKNSIIGWFFAIRS